MTQEPQDHIAEAIKRVISNLMDRVMDKVLVQDPFIVEKHRAAKPLYSALVPDEIFKGSHFERRFVTPFGGVWEKLAKVVALEAHGSCIIGHTITGAVGAESLRRIQSVLNRLEHKETDQERIKPDWKQELKYIQDGGGELIPTSVVCDLFIESNRTGEKYAFELKAPLPNSDQTKVSKEKIFKLFVMQPKKVDHAFYALPYNPYGKKEDYKWSFPARWFNMQTDECVLIGDEFWELIGGEGTYSKFVTEVNLLGKDYRERIYKEFLGIEPPENIDEEVLK
ncbi:MAG: TdeIII family type II restriction endonuclease [Cyanobacteria bacterium CAN_BIN43]|nr:TdeIII family type II restriction endonuclease [Cyanobacteria bacterium CAN_BIN43]